MVSLKLFFFSTNKKMQNFFQYDLNIIIKKLNIFCSGRALGHAKAKEKLFFKNQQQMQKKKGGDCLALPVIDIIHVGVFLLYLIILPGQKYTRIRILLCYQNEKKKKWNYDCYTLVRIFVIFFHIRYQTESQFCYT